MVLAHPHAQKLGNTPSLILSLPGPGRERGALDLTKEFRLAWSTSPAFPPTLSSSSSPESRRTTGHCNAFSLRLQPLEFA